MPSTHYSEIALARRREKQDLAAGFPGLLASWDEAAGKTLARVVTVGDGVLVLFSDGSLLAARTVPLSGEGLLTALLAARESLREHHREAVGELELRVAAESEAMRLARMEKVLGAVETNLPRIPELRDALGKLLASPTEGRAGDDDEGAPLSAASPPGG